jgi:hypothetical protein
MEPPALTGSRAWLIGQSGTRAGVRYAVGDRATRLGRALDNDIVIEGPDAACVSQQHLEIRREGAGFRLRDLGSTNGTFLNGERISEAELPAPAAIRVGTQGPEFSFVVESPAAGLGETVEIPAGMAAPPVASDAASLGGTFDGLLVDAVERARQARAKGVSDQTIMIMRDTLRRAIRHSSRRFHLMIWTLVAGLLAVSGFAAWKIVSLDRQKAAIDGRIRVVEAQLEKANAAGSEADRLADELDIYEGEAEQLQSSLFYRVSRHPQEDYVTREVRTLLAEFGAEVYSVPPEFIEQVKRYIGLYSGSNRPLMEQALSGSSEKFAYVKRMLEESHLPPDLAYIPVVEGAMKTGEPNAAGAAGPWQFTAVTARANGLRVDATADQRFNLHLSTAAACRYLRNLILDFGSGTSIMLALAAYNSGPTKVKDAILKTVKDPIKQRNFWYLYRVRALPEETREYVPKVFAVMIIGRNPEHFGFGAAAN